LIPIRCVQDQMAHERRKPFFQSTFDYELKDECFRKRAPSRLLQHVNSPSAEKLGPDGQDALVKVEMRIVHWSPAFLAHAQEDRATRDPFQEKGFVL